MGLWKVTTKFSADRMGSFGTRIALLSDPELGQGVGLHGLPRWH